MTIQPQQPNPPAGWYPQPNGMQRYWDGRGWTEHWAPIQQAPPQPQMVVVQQAGPRSISGMSNGTRIVHIVLCVCTLGLWLPIYLLSEWLSRTKVRY